MYNNVTTGAVRGAGSNHEAGTHEDSNRIRNNQKKMVRRILAIFSAFVVFAAAALSALYISEIHKYEYDIYLFEILIDNKLIQWNNMKILEIHKFKLNT